MGKIGTKISNPDQDSKIAYIKEMKEIIETGTDGIPTKFYEPILGGIKINKKTKEMIWNAIAEVSEDRIQPFIILVPKKYITKKNLLVEEIPIPFANHVLYIVPHIRKIMIYETWNDKDDE